MNKSEGVNQMVFAHIAGIWVSGTVQNVTGNVLIIQLVTGTTINRLQSEVKETSPRLDDHSIWPL